MFNYGSREIIKLVIQALHQRLSERLTFLISMHVWDEENVFKIEFSNSFAFFKNKNCMKNTLSIVHNRVNVMQNATSCSVLLFFCVGVWSSY